jgi:hypothetical protein
MEFLRLIKKPSLHFFPGIKVTKETELEFKTDSCTQTLKNLVFRCVRSVAGENYEGSYETTIYLQPGDVLIYESDERGYVKPVEEFMTVAEAAAELEAIKDL